MPQRWHWLSCPIYAPRHRPAVPGLPVGQRRLRQRHRGGHDLPVPGPAAEFRRRAEEQAESRLYAGIHWRYDAISLEGGRTVAGLVIDRARADGADAAP